MVNVLGEFHRGQMSVGSCLRGGGKSLGGNCPVGKFHQEQLPRDNYPGGKSLEGIVLEGISWGAIVRGAVVQGGNIRRPFNKSIIRTENFVHFLSCAIFVCYCMENYISMVIVRKN